ncbi:hypothetical protein ABK040_015934 [Willaertia magna]
MLQQNNNGELTLLEFLSAMNEPFKVIKTLDGKYYLRCNDQSEGTYMKGSISLTDKDEEVLLSEQEVNQLIQEFNNLQQSSTGNNERHMGDAVVTIHSVNSGNTSTTFYVNGNAASNVRTTLKGLLQRNTTNNNNSATTSNESSYEPTEEEEEQLNNSSCHIKSLFTQLPNELLLYIADFLIGNNHLKDNDFLLSLRYIKPLNSNSHDEEDKKNNEYYLQQYIPPFENIKTLLNLQYCNKYIFQSLTGNSVGVVTNSANLIKKENEELISREWNEVDNYWLERINFYEKYLYWMKTSSFDDLRLGIGDLTAREINEMCKVQTLIQRIERGLIVDEKDAIDKESFWGNENNDEDDEEEEKKKKKSQELPL